MKNVVEANASYSAEVCMYAFFLSNWLLTEGKAYSDKFFVSDRIYLWKHVEMPNFQRNLGLKAAATAKKRIEALLVDLNDGLVDYLIFMPSVRKFFKEDVPRVVQKGDSEGWASVPYHVNTKCGACDWLGNKEWLFGSSLDHYNKHSEDYCLQAADTVDHLSQMAGLSKGASQILADGGHSKVAELVDIPATATVLKKHALLKKDKSQIGEKAKALTTGNITSDGISRISGLAKSLNAEFDIIVNFDSGTGLLTGIAIRAIAFPPYQQTFNVNGEQKTFLSFREEAFVVEKDLLNTEWVALYGFIKKFSAWATQIQQTFTENGWGSVSTQVCFWESRQYEELCNAFGRHLLQVLELQDREAKALAWLFPAEELMEKNEEIAPCIIFIKDIVDLNLRLPVKFANTLLGVAEVYHLSNMTPRNIDNYYKERLGNSIPRERIFEIWKCTTAEIPYYGRPSSLSDAIGRYGTALKAHSWALASITAKLRNDFRTQLTGKAPALDLSIPRGANNLAYDSKLWLQWENVETATSETEQKANLITKAERLEASYEAIVLTNLINNLGNNRFEFEVSEESTEAKLEEGNAFYVLGIESNPGFPLETGFSLGIDINPPAIDYSHIRIPMHSVITVSLERFDRVNRRAIIEIRARSRAVTGIFDAVQRMGLIPIGVQSIFITEGMPYDDSRTTSSILREIGNPTNSKVAPESLIAMGSASRRLVAGSDNITPAANVLWDAGRLAVNEVRNDDEAKAISNYAKQVTPKGLNQSQENAIYNASKYQLSVIWGPPGTGKTNTLSGLIHSLVFESKSTGKTRKVLITGPNYRTVEELASRLLDSIDKDENCPVDMFWAYSRSRDPKDLPEVKEHINAYSFQPNTFIPNAETLALIESLNNPDTTTIIATSAHIIMSYIAPLFSSTNYLKEIFDLVVIDESSQVPVTMALRPLSVLKSTGQLVVAGDHLQMPPISSLDAPKNAEYLVGSIQTYLLKREGFNINPNRLLINYRSNQDLVDFAKTLDYPAELEAHNKDRQLQQIEDLDEVLKNLPQNLLKSNAYKAILTPEKRVTTLIHDDIVSSQANEVEAKLVAGMAYCLRNTMSKDLYPQPDGFVYEPYTDEQFFKFGIGVVTPHKAQKALVIKELRLLFPNVDGELIFNAVDTVERFQGGERQSIIVSYGVGDLDIIEGEEEFLLQMERTNVAVSRAKAKCIVLMPKALAYHLPSDVKAVKTAKAIKSYVEEFCSQRVDIEIEDNGQIRKGEVRWH